MNQEEAHQPIVPGSKLRIIATIGPASRAMSTALRDSGADVFRLNSSHLGPAELEHAAVQCRTGAPETPIVVDLQGAKMRVGEFAPRRLHEGEGLRFALWAGGEDVPLPHPELFGSARPGDTLGCDDDRLRFRIVSVHENAMEARALSTGTLLPRKGVNVLEHPVHLAGLTEADRSAIAATRALARVSYAFSFMDDGSEAEWIRKHAPGCPVIGKVERREAAGNLEAIAGAVDTVWICRGDLGAQLGLPEMARWVASVEPHRLRIPVLMAGQVLEHLTGHASPTRAEVCHIFDLCRRGYAGFVLSDETAIGRDPAAAVKTLRSLLDAFGQAR